MKSKPQRKLSSTARRPAYRTLEGWALGVLIEQQAECEHHGYRRDRSDPDAWTRARENPQAERGIHLMAPALYLFDHD